MSEAHGHKPIISQPVPPINLYIDRLEFTQATEIGNTTSTIPKVYEQILVERKDVTVRVFLGVRGTTPVPFGTQFGGELSIPGLPTFFPVTGPISGDVVTTDSYQSPPGIPPTGDKNLDQRGQNGQSLMFSIPGEICIGTLHCSVSVYPLDQTTNRITQAFNVPPDAQSAVSVGTTEVAFIPVKPLRIQPVLVRYTGPITVRLPGGTSGSPHLIYTIDATATLDEALQALDWVKKVYPISDLTVEPPLTTAWAADISQPENLWTLRQQIADLRPAGDTSTIYVGFLASEVFPVNAFQLARGIGLVSDHTALTVAQNGPATAHAIGRALGLLIIECGTPLPPYALPFTSGLINWDTGAQPWGWGGKGQKANYSAYGIALPGATLPAWSLTTPPDSTVISLSSGNMSLAVSRSDSEWQPKDSGFSLTIQTDAAGENVIDTSTIMPPGSPPPPTVTTTAIQSPPKYTAFTGVVMDCTQKFSCEFTVLGSKPVQLFLNLNQRPNLKSGISIVPLNASDPNQASFSTDGAPIGAANSGFDYSTYGFAMEAQPPATPPPPLKQLSLSPGDYLLTADADLNVDDSGGAETTLNGNSSQASSYTIGTGQFVLAENLPISETVPVTGNLPPGTIADVGVDNQQFWVYNPQKYFDFMSFCDKPWVSPYTYKNLLTALNAL